MDPHEMKRLYGKRITLHGTISLQETLPFGTPDDVRAEVIDRIENCGYDGGLVISPSNNLELDVPIENIITMYQTAREYRPTFA